MAHILIAEKDEPVAKWLRRELALLGHTCCVAGDAQQAQALSHSEAFDLVLADAAMPELALAHTLLVPLRQRAAPRVHRPAAAKRRFPRTYR